MTELVSIVAGADPVQAIAIVVLVVGCAFALMLGVVGVAKALFDFFSSLK